MTEEPTAIDFGIFANSQHYQVEIALSSFIMKLSIDDYLDMRDYQGASALLEFSNKKDKELWKAYCYFHNRDFEGARKMYERLLHATSGTRGRQKNSSQSQQDVRLYIACCDYHLKKYDDAMKSISEYSGSGANTSPLKSRIVSLLKKKGCAIAVDTEQQSMDNSGSDDYVYGEMFKAAMLYADCSFQEAVEIYKNILRLHPEFLSLNVFVAMCYFKMVSCSS